MATWSGLTGVREIMERLRGGLRTFRDENGAELFDLPDAPLADPDTPAPVRFLPEYDNVFLSHADRSRIGDPADRPQLGFGDGRFFSLVLIGGFLRAVWRLENGDVLVKPARRLSKRGRRRRGRRGPTAGRLPGRRRGAHTPGVTGRLYAGASGFSYPCWRGGFYPADAKPDTFLRLYAERVNAVELNNTFYRVRRGGPVRPLGRAGAGRIPLRA